MNSRMAGRRFDLPWPPARNPWNREHFTGGSSSGSGAAVAAGFVPGALGSDTGGSIRGPAALCGIVGLKPTYGLVSRHGVYANSFSFDHAGPMTWTVEDCAIMLQAIAGHDPNDPASATRPAPGLPRGADRRHQGPAHRHRAPPARGRLPGDAPRSRRRSTKRLPSSARSARRSARCGCGRRRIITTSRSRSPRASCSPCTSSALRTRPGDFGEDFLGRVLPAVLISARDYVQAQRERRRILAEMAPVYAKLRRAGDRDRGRPGAAARHLAHDRVLAATVIDDAVQCHRRPGISAMHRVQQRRAAVVDADRRPAL